MLCSCLLLLSIKYIFIECLFADWLHEAQEQMCRSKSAQEGALGIFTRPSGTRAPPSPPPPCHYCFCLRLTARHSWSLVASPGLRCVVNKMRTSISLRLLLALNFESEIFNIERNRNSLKNADVTGKWFAFSVVCIRIWKPEYCFQYITCL